MLYATKKLPNGFKLEIDVRFDDSCNNGHRTFAITGLLTDPKGRFDAAGAIHDEIVEAAPELAPYIKWHLCGEHEPLHYVANTDEDLRIEGLKDRLMARLPNLMAEFRKDMESLGFEW